MISPNSHEVTFNEIQKTRLKDDENASSDWKGIRHSNFLDALFEAFSHHGFRIKTSRYALSKDKRDLVCDHDVGITGYTPIKGWVPCIGAIASNARTLRTRIVVGMTHVKTEVGYVHKIISLGKRTTGFDLAQIEETVEQCRSEYPSIEIGMETLLETTLLQKHIDKIIMRASRCRPVSPQWWTRPSWEALGNTLKFYNSGEDKSAMGLMLAYGQATKRSMIFRQIPQLFRFRQILTHTVKVKV